MSFAIELAELGFFPDQIIRYGVHGLVKERLEESNELASGNHATVLERFVDSLRDAPIAEVPNLANDQHYEVPAVKDVTEAFIPDDSVDVNCPC